ncbi:MAG TPA: hypothetical protein VHC23_12925, partial [Jatrophihabitans sp.]|nr:hypothetical protein [Jatrophihabitans sp.]
MAITWTRRGSREPSPAERRVAELDALENGWRRALVRDERINAHLLALLRRAGVTGGRVLEIGGRQHPRGPALGPAFDYLNLDLEASDEH